ncbi:hypothetical protein M0R45_014916 [Rubus argutus]|uniref:Uncharacterized protein n=1 Tax=Rubus argutus TaxID=59490 RepID=A0AAW1XMN8_RUBAR
MSSDEPEYSQGLTPDERENLFWLKLPGWADDMPENTVFHMLEETAIRHRFPLQPYDPDNKERGRKILLHNKSDVAKYRCMACGKEDEHFTFQCPNDPGIYIVF